MCWGMGDEDIGDADMGDEDIGDEDIGDADIGDEDMGWDELFRRSDMHATWERERQGIARIFYSTTVRPSSTRQISSPNLIYSPGVNL